LPSEPRRSGSGPLTLLSLLVITACSAQVAPQWTLPDDVAPLEHTIQMTLDPRLATFTGVARIDVQLKSARDNIWVNGHDITVQKATIIVDSTKHIASVRMAANEFIGLALKKSIGPGRATLEIAYTAKLSDTAKSGPYRRQTAGDWYAFTVFTPIDARRAFPCFDEPRFKTVWNMSIRVKQSDKAFANAPEIATDVQPKGMKLVHFAPTQKIPAEVVAFAVGPFDVYDGGRAGKRNTAVRVLTPRGRKNEGKTAADATRRVLPSLEAYTGIAYPWDKLDHVALPEGAFGAVENPGLITYLSRSLLLPADAPPEKLRSLDGLEAHELAHQWFGNLVTQSSWDDVWLSEGFATWFSAEVMDESHLQIEARRARIMASDDGPKSHPVHNPKHTRTEMESVYDQFPYQKGAGILLTLESWLGKEQLRDGLRAYLTKHASGNASSEDLSAELSKASGQDVKPVLDSMLDHKGVPVIEGSCQNGKATVTQPAASVQIIPVCYRTSDASACVVASRAITEMAMNCPAWILWNSGGMGYFHTRWTSPSSIPPLDALTPAERLTLALDLKWSIQQGALNGQDVVELMKALENDKVPEVSAAAKSTSTK
jgi:cytosol alanyl aminopeptidase